MIPIQRSSEYALRAMTHMARATGDGFFLVRDMARELEIPAPFLGKVLQPLVGRGLLQSQRGRGGGFRLARASDEISLFEVVDTQERVVQDRACFLGQAECSDERACPMHEFWKQAYDGFLRHLASTSLADMVRFCEENGASGYPLPEG